MFYRLFSSVFGGVSLISLLFMITLIVADINNIEWGVVLFVFIVFAVSMALCDILKNQYMNYIPKNPCYLCKKPLKKTDSKIIDSKGQDLKICNECNEELKNII